MCLDSLFRLVGSPIHSHRNVLHGLWESSSRIVIFKPIAVWVRAE
jgi:hypothetical protein